MEQNNEQLSNGLVPVSAGDWDKNTRYSVKDGECTPIVKHGFNYFILCDKEAVVQGVAPDSEEGAKYWRKYEFPRLVWCEALLKPHYCVDFQDEGSIRLFMKREEAKRRKQLAQSRRVSMQREELGDDPRALASILRCLRYHDRIPRKYRRRYGDVIKVFKYINGFWEKPLLIGTKC